MTWHRVCVRNQWRNCCRCRCKCQGKHDHITASCGWRIQIVFSPFFCLFFSWSDFCPDSHHLLMGRSLWRPVIVKPVRWRCHWARRLPGMKRVKWSNQIHQCRVCDSHKTHEIHICFLCSLSACAVRWASRWPILRAANCCSVSTHTNHI